jgi:serine/threonine-protein kinase
MTPDVRASLRVLKLPIARSATHDVATQALVDEATLGRHLEHPNVARVIGLVAESHHRALACEYVHGPDLATLMRASPQALPLGIVVRVVLDLLDALIVVHRATNDDGVPMCIVHRDISPHNVVFGVDGRARLIDFGVASARAVPRLNATQGGGVHVRGKLAYVAPELLLERPATQRADLYAVAVLMWEALRGARLFAGPSAVATMHRVLQMPVPRLEHVTTGLWRWIQKGLSRDAEARFASAEEMKVGLLSIATPASRRACAAWLGTRPLAVLDARERNIRAMREELLQGDGELPQARAAMRSRVPRDAVVASVSAPMCHALVPNVYGMPTSVPRVAPVEPVEPVEPIEPVTTKTLRLPKAPAKGPRTKRMNVHYARDLPYPYRAWLQAYLHVLTPLELLVLCLLACVHIWLLLR